MTTAYVRFRRFAASHSGSIASLTGEVCFSSVYPNDVALQPLAGNFSVYLLHHGLLVKRGYVKRAGPSLDRPFASLHIIALVQPGAAGGGSWK